MRLKYKFVGRYKTVDNLVPKYIYEWQAKIPGDSRVHRVTCEVDWFWRRREPSGNTTITIDRYGEELWTSIRSSRD